MRLNRYQAERLTERLKWKLKVRNELKSNMPVCQFYHFWKLSSYNYNHRQTTLTLIIKRQTNYYLDCIATVWTTVLLEWPNNWIRINGKRQLFTYSIQLHQQLISDDTGDVFLNSRGQELEHWCISECHLMIKQLYRSN